MSNQYCPQCGYYHPPLNEGEECPMAQRFDSDGKEINVQPFLNQIKNIVISNLQNKKIEDHESFYKYVLTELTKIIEKYQEK